MLNAESFNDLLEELPLEKALLVVQVDTLICKKKAKKRHFKEKGLFVQEIIEAFFNMFDRNFVEFVCDVALREGLKSLEGLGGSKTPTIKELLEKHGV